MFALRCGTVAQHSVSLDARQHRAYSVLCVRCWTVRRNDCTNHVCLHRPVCSWALRQRCWSGHKPVYKRVHRRLLLSCGVYLPHREHMPHRHLQRVWLWQLLGLPGRDLRLLQRLDNLELLRRLSSWPVLPGWDCLLLAVPSRVRGLDHRVDNRLMLWCLQSGVCQRRRGSGLHPVYLRLLQQHLRVIFLHHLPSCTVRRQLRVHVMHTLSRWHVWQHNRPLYDGVQWPVWCRDVFLRR